MRQVNVRHRRKKWQFRVLLIGLLIAVTLETVGVNVYGLFGAARGNNRLLHTNITTPPTLVENFTPPPRQLSKAQLQKLKLFRKQYTSLRNHSNQKLLARSPYVHFGKYQYQFHDRDPNETTERRKVVSLLEAEKPSLIANSRTFVLHDNLLNERGQHQEPKGRSAATDTDTWVLPNSLQHPTRDHDTIILEQATENGSAVVAVTLLGRFSRFVQWMDLVTGQQRSRRTNNLKDPAGMPLDDLNHVSAVLVDSLFLDENSAFQTRQEIWLPCGFHNDRAGSEVSSSYVRIVDVKTLQIRTGPKLPIAGGACVATAIHVTPHDQPMICIFGGTQGNHNRGKFLKETACYDRRRLTWWSPFGNLPFGLDHGSLAFIPAGVCTPTDPARIIILNFRTKPYSDARSEMLAFDIPSSRWTLDELEASIDRTKSSWYLYHNDTSKELLDMGRDASGTIVVNGGRQIVNFGGSYYIPGDKKRSKGRFSMIRSFDVCQKRWSIIGDLGFQTSALQSAASDELQLAISCGGEAPLQQNINGPWCFVSRFHNNMRLSNRYELVYGPKKNPPVATAK